MDCSLKPRLVLVFRKCDGVSCCISKIVRKKRDRRVSVYWLLEWIINTQGLIYNRNLRCQRTAETIVRFRIALAALLTAVCSRCTGLVSKTRTSVNIGTISDDAVHRASYVDGPVLSADVLSQILVTHEYIMQHAQSVTACYSASRTAKWHSLRLR